MKATLYGPGLGASVPSAHSLFTSALHNVPPAACETSGCVATREQQSSLVAMQQRSIVLRQSPFQGHIIVALDTARAILVSAEQTGISSAQINHFTGEGALLCPVASRLVVNVCGRFQ